MPVKLKLIHAIYASHERKKWIKFKNNINQKVRKIIENIEKKPLEKIFQKKISKQNFRYVQKIKATNQKFKIAGVEFEEKYTNFAGPIWLSKRLIMDIAKNVKKNGAHFGWCI